LSGRTHQYVLDLGDDEIAKARQHLESIGVDVRKPIIGLNHGAGGRWPLKQWREDGYIELISRLGRERDVQLLLLGGPPERQRNETLRRAVRVPLFDCGCDNPVRHFAALVDHCHVVVTGDTLAMHIALARRKRLVVNFGPTSAPEIELYGLGEKVIPDMTCLSCYKNACDFVPNCMDLISTEMMEQAVQRQLSIARGQLVVQEI
jgi:heptosyltransferase-2